MAGIKARMESGYTMETGRATVAARIAKEHGLRARVIVHGPGGYSTPLDERAGSTYVHVKTGESAILISVPIGTDESPFWEELNRLIPRSRPE